MDFSNVIVWKQFKKSVSNEKNAQLLLIKNIANTYCHFAFSSFLDADEEDIMLPANWAGIIWFFKGTLKKKSGRCKYYSVDLMRLAKLQAFIDEVFKCKLIYYQKTPFFKQFEMPAVHHMVSFQQFEYWYLNQVYSPMESHSAIIRFIRSTEWYQLVSFLIKESRSETLSIKKLSEKYGLSSSYFRYLCKQVLGGTLKGQISDWRLASALIDMTKSQLSATDVAYRSGYSSLSHFSKEVKKTMGHSPRDLKKIIVS